MFERVLPVVLFFLISLQLIFKKGEVLELLVQTYNGLRNNNYQ